MVRLRREYRELKCERDFYEQATAYFAKGEPWNPRSSPRSEVTSRSPGDGRSPQARLRAGGAKHRLDLGHDVCAHLGRLAVPGRCH